MMDPNSERHRINFQVVFAEQGQTLTDSDVEETKMSTSRALKVLLKYMMIKSIVYSKQMIGTIAVENVLKTTTLPDMTVDRTFEELRNLSITKLSWCGYGTL